MPPFLGAGSVNTLPLRADTSRPEANDHPRRQQSAQQENTGQSQRGHCLHSLSSRAQPRLLSHSPQGEGQGLTCLMTQWPLLLPGACTRSSRSDQTLHNRASPSSSPSSKTTCLMRLTQLPSSPQSSSPYHSTCQSTTLHYLYSRGVYHLQTGCVTYLFIIICSPFPH